MPANGRTSSFTSPRARRARPGATRLRRWKARSSRRHHLGRDRRHRVLGGRRVAVPHHARSGNRNDNKFIDNGPTYQQVTDDNSIGRGIRRQLSQCETAGDRGADGGLARPGQGAANALRHFQRHVYAHNWIDYKDSRYCEGCELSKIARTQNLEKRFPSRKSAVSARLARPMAVKSGCRRSPGAARA